MRRILPDPLAPLLVVLAILGTTLGTALGTAADATSAPLRYRIEPGTEGNEVRFHSEASIESFDGTTDRVSGWVEVDPDDLASGVRWRVEVDLASLDTGIGLRNRHMRENHLHTDEHPLAVFEGAMDGSTLPAALGPAPTTVELHGEFSLHGVTRERTLEVEVMRRPDDALVVESEFGVTLSDHDIPRPKFLLLKLAQEQDVRIRVIAHRPEETSR